jgi:hypothetical protein
MEEPQQLTPAEKYYLIHKEAHKRYYAKNKEKLCQVSRDHFQKTKSDPEKYAEYLEKKKQRYLELKQDPEYVEKTRERGRLRYQKKKELLQKLMEQTNNDNNE